MDIEKINTKYCLHECIINKIEIKDSNLILYLDKGVYEYDDNAGKYKITENCKIFMKIDALNNETSYEHISISIFKKNVKKDISFNEFSKMVNQDSFKIYLDFYSSFVKGILLKGTCNKHEVELLITEVNDIQFILPSD